MTLAMNERDLFRTFVPETDEREDAGAVDAIDDESAALAALSQEVDAVADRTHFRELQAVVQQMSRKEVRFLVATYYQWQEHRIASGNQVRSLVKESEPHAVLAWTQQRMHGMEAAALKLLDTYTETEGTGMGVWVRSIFGVGPVMAAGLIAHIDITQAPTVGHIWRLAGLDPTLPWLGTERARTLVDEVVGKARQVSPEHLVALAQATNRTPGAVERIGRDRKKGTLTRDSLAKGLARRPWNAVLKVVCWKLGESFVKVKGNPKDVYGKVYVQRKAYEQAQNAQGRYADQAKVKLERFKIGKDTEARKWYEKGLLPPGHLHARAKRYAVKLFLSHYHHEAYVRHYGTEPPLPYPIAQRGHAHFIAPPAV